MAEDTLLAEMRIHVEADVVPRPEHWRECVALHPNEPCPGYPHETEETEES